MQNDKKGREYNLIRGCVCIYNLCQLISECVNRLLKLPTLLEDAMVINFITDILQCHKRISN